MRSVDLNGEWELANSGRNIKVPARVPGQVQLDLLRAGLIADPYVGNAEETLGWIAEEVWEYRREFSVDDALLGKNQACLVCEGLDTVAEIYVNGVGVGRAQNQFRAHTFPVKPHLKAGSNSLRIVFQPAAAYAAQQARSHPAPLPYVDYTGKDEHRNFIRKCQADFGWDWGPALHPVGIWRPLRLEAWSEARLTAVVCRQTHLPHGDVLLQLRVWLDSPRGARGRLEARLGLNLTQQEVELPAGETCVMWDWRLEHPRRWWPLGYGEQVLHPLNLVFIGAGGEIDTHTEKIGFRSLELVRQPDAQGETFYLQVNGVPVFAKGANWIPADCFPARVTRDRLRDLLESARAAHLNLLRVWGGGVYESDDFYDLCDEYGILVWQDFMFACALYPGDDGFLQEVEAEARAQVRRLAAHACLALWCGNNENELALLGAVWSHPEHRDEYQRDYRRLYLELLPRVLAAEDPERPYWPGSPANGLDLGGEPNDFTRGDVHAWDVWSRGSDFTEFAQMHPRFVSEFGYQSAPSLASLQKVLPPGELDFHGREFLRRQHCEFGHRTLEKQMAVWFPPPRDFAETVYYTQVLQALCLKYAIEHWRRMRPECMGIVYWQLNDIWPGMSWSSLEYSGSWKLLHHQLRTLFAPVLISAGEAFGRLEVWVCNDGLESISGNLTIQLWSWSGEKLREYSLNATVPGQGSRKCWDAPWPELFPEPCQHERFFTLRLAGTGVDVRNVYFPEPFNRTRLAGAQIRISKIREREGRLEFQVSADKPAPYVYLTAGTLPGRFSDNGFWLMPSEPRGIFFQAAEKLSMETFKHNLQVRGIV